MSATSELHFNLSEAMATLVCTAYAAGMSKQSLMEFVTEYMDESLMVDNMPESDDEPCDFIHCDPMYMGTIAASPYVIAIDYKSF